MASVFVVNVQCALVFIVSPARYAASFQVGGLGAETAVQAMAVLFLMWNATYPLVVIDPVRHFTLFGVVLVQQVIGVVGESWLWATLPQGTDALSSSLARFVAFDVVGLILMACAYLVLRRSVHAVD